MNTDELRALAESADRQSREMVEARRYIRKALRRIIRECQTLQRELRGHLDVSAAPSP